MGGRAFAILVLVTLSIGLTPTAAAQKDVDVFNWGVPYFVGTGMQGSAHFALGPNYQANATQMIPFDGCASILARPAKSLGSVDMVGLLDETNLLELNFDEFRAPSPEMQRFAPQGIGANITLDGSEDHTNRTQHPKVFARVVAWGTGHLMIDGENFTDDGVTPKPFWSSFYITPNGFRNDTTQKIDTKSGAPYAPGKTKDPVVGVEDWELHLRVEGKSPKRTSVQTYRPQGDSPDGSIIYEEEHVATFRFLNQAPGGIANLTFQANSRGPPGATNLRFQVFSPKDTEMVSYSVAPSALTNTPGKTVSLALNNFGVYTVKVTGKIVAGTYTITNRLTHASTFDFNMWWDNVSFERPALRESSGCKDRLINNLTRAHPEGIGRSAARTLSIETLGVGISVAVVAALFVVKLVADAVIMGQFKAVFKGKK